MKKLKNQRSIIKVKTQTIDQLLQLDTLKKFDITEIKPNKTHPWETVDNIYRKKMRTLDKNIDQVYDYVTPQANSIYYDRKIEFQNIVDNRKNSEE